MTNKKFAEENAGRLCLYRGYSVKIVGYFEDVDNVIIITGYPSGWDRSLLSQRHIILESVQGSDKFRCVYISELTMEKYDKEQ